MSQEGQLLDKKSLRPVTGKTADWNELAKDCVAFVNASCGRLLIGIEDNQDHPDVNQIIPDDLPDTVRRKLAKRTVNVTSLPVVVTDTNGGRFIELSIPQSIAVASSTSETTLKRIELHRLAALVLEYLQRYLESAISDIHQRIGGEIHPKQIKRALEELIERGTVRFEGNNRWRWYWAVS